MDKIIRFLLRYDRRAYESGRLRGGTFDNSSEIDIVDRVLDNESKTVRVDGKVLPTTREYMRGGLRI